MLDECKARKDRTVGLCPLPEVELHCTILHQHMRVEGLAPQGFLLNSESNAHPLPVLGEGKFHVISTFKVLEEKAKEENLKPTLSLKALRTTSWREQMQ